jgi:aminoglycoside phosphotransferase (APT) family kinase protein
MQSESSLFGLLFHKTLMGILATEGQSLTPRAQLLLTRVSEGLQYFALRESAPPEAAAQARASLLALLKDTVEEIDHRGLEAPPNARLLASADQTPTSPRFEDLVVAQAECIAKLSSRDSSVPKRGTASARLIQRSFEIQQGVRDSLKQRQAAHVAEPFPSAVDATLDPPSASQLQSLLHAAGISPQIEVQTIRPLFSHSSKQAFVVTTNGADNWPTQAILRREPAYSIVDTSLPDEYDVLDVAYRAGLPVPRPLFAGHHAADLGGRFILMSFVTGSARSAASLGGDLPTVLKQAASFLARLHRIDPRDVARMRAAGEESWQSRLTGRMQSIYDIWLRDRVEPSVLIESAFAWLRMHAPSVHEEPCIVHGDYDLRNILVDSGGISAVVDWETSRLGHRAEDPAYFKRQISRGMPWAEFMAEYESHTMRRIAMSDIQFFEVMSWLWRTVVTITAYSGYYRGTHEDFFFATTRYAEYEDSLDGLAEAMRAAEIGA